MNKKAFISHASDDKDRFVIDFSKKLMANGVDAWLDKWEMLPGDSLVDKIFEEGISEADIFIIVLSRNSVDRPWVQEELNAGFVKRVSNKCKVIPIVLDDCKVPECLQSTIWEKIEDYNSYDESLQRILNSIFGLSDKPSLGEVPASVSLKINEIYGLNKIDNIVFTEACNFMMNNMTNSVSVTDIEQQLKSKKISDEDIAESLDVLDKQNYIKASRVIGKLEIPFFTITTFGFDEYAKANINDYSSIIDNISLKIINESLTDNISIEKMLSYSRILIDNILCLLSDRGLIKITECIGGEIFIGHVSVDFKRLYR